MAFPTQTSVAPTMRSRDVQVYVRAAATLGEGPMWDGGVLYWVDITEGMVFAKADGMALVRKWAVGTSVGSLACAGERRLILATGRGFQMLDLETGALEAGPHPEAHLPGNRFNDGKCDPRGRFLAGTLYPGGSPRAALYALDLDGAVRKILDRVTCSNGLAWSADGQTLYYIDTPTRLVRAFPYDLENGGIGDATAVIEIPAAHGKPDGMTIDRAGNLWIGLWDGWGVECWDPRSGRQLDRIELPVARATSCVFGGHDYRTLFITTAREGLTAGQLARQPLAGSVFSAQPGVAGFPATHFNGRLR